MFGKKNMPVPFEGTPDDHLPVPSESHGHGRIVRGEEELPATHGGAGYAAHAEGEEGRTHFQSAERKLETEDFLRAKSIVIEALVERIDFRTMQGITEAAKRSRVGGIIDEFVSRELLIPLTAPQQQLLRLQVIDDLLGFGPLEVLLADPDISDIMINGPKRIYIEKRGKLSVSDITFSSEKHLLNVIQKVVGLVGRRIDESSPMVDARMPDGSRFNAIIPPLALDGSLVSIRKFKRNKMPLREYVEFDSMSVEMYRFLEICGNIRLNIIISGGTGSGKTTLLNAISGHIDPGERVITIEDAAELQLHQPHVLRLETRPTSKAWARSTSASW